MRAAKPSLVPVSAVNNLLELLCRVWSRFSSFPQNRSICILGLNWLDVIPSRRTRIMRVKHASLLFNSKLFRAACQASLRKILLLSQISPLDLLLVLALLLHSCPKSTFMTITLKSLSISAKVNFMLIRNKTKFTSWFVVTLSLGIYPTRITCTLCCWICKLYLSQLTCSELKGWPNSKSFNFLHEILSSSLKWPPTFASALLSSTLLHCSKSWSKPSLVNYATLWAQSSSAYAGTVITQLSQVSLCNSESQMAFLIS